MQPLVHLNYKIDKEHLLEEASRLKHLAVGYTDSRYPGMKMNNWLFAYCTSPYIDNILKDFGVEGKTRFYWLQPFANIPEHIDNETRCGLNFILTDNASPITYQGVDYFYESALIDTTKPHSVTNNEHERIMFKVSIVNETFEQVLSKIGKYVCD